MSLAEIDRLKARLSQLKGRKQILDQTLAQAAKAVQISAEQLRGIDISTVEQARQKKVEFETRLQELISEIDSELSVIEGDQNVGS